MRASTLRISLGLLCLGLLAPDGALAARKAPPPPAAEAQATAKDTGKGPSTAWTAAEPANCTRLRRKLWQDGEGWIVKTVNICR